MSLLYMIAGEMLLVPGVEMKDHGDEEMELHLVGKSFAHIHSPDRIELRLPPDLKEVMISQGTVSRSPEAHDYEGSVMLKLAASEDVRRPKEVHHSEIYLASATMRS